MKKEYLAPCKFCGGENLRVVDFGEFLDDFGIAVMCDDCKAVGSSGISIDDAMEKWGLKNKKEV